LKRPAHSVPHVQQQVPTPAHPFCGACGIAPAQPSTLHAVPVVQVVEKVHPEILPFSNPPFVTRLPAQVGLHTIGVGEGVNVIVGDPVRVGLIVQVRVIVLVCHGVQVRESVGGQVMVRVGVNGTAQQTCTSA